MKIIAIYTLHLPTQSELKIAPALRVVPKNRSLCVTKSSFRWLNVTFRALIEQFLGTTGMVMKRQQPLGRTYTALPSTLKSPT